MRNHTTSFLTFIIIKLFYNIFGKECGKVMKELYISLESFGFNIDNLCTREMEIFEEMIDSSIYTYKANPYIKDFTDFSM